MPLLQLVAKRIQRLVTGYLGSQSSYSDYDYICGEIADSNDDIEAELDMLDLHFDQAVVVLTNVPAGTVDLSAYQADGQQLGNLLFPMSADGSEPIEWRPTGQSDLNWQPVPQVGKVLDTNTATGNTGLITSDTAAIISWEWRGGIIIISPSSQAVDLRIRGEFTPNLADNDAAQYVKGLKNVLSYLVAKKILGYAKNAEGIEFCDEQLEEAKFVFESRMSKMKHGQVIRLGGRRTQAGGVIGRFTPPIVN